MEKKDILVIGDAHAKPGVSNERFYWAGRYAADQNVDIVVDMGDWADMDSLCSYDYGKKSYEGRRYLQDVQAAVDARKEFNRGIEVHNRKLAKAHKAKYAPTKYALGGNHDEGRITRVIEGDSKLEGLISVKDFQHAEYGWEYVPFMEPVEIQGFTFQHYFTSGVAGRPISGEMPALSIIRKQFTSCVSAHSHVWDCAHRTRPDGSRLWGLVAGCYLAKEQWETYAGPANKLWWRGLTTLRGCLNGDLDAMETIQMEELQRRYG